MCSTSINGVKIAAEASQGVKIDSYVAFRLLEVEDRV